MEFFDLIQKRHSVRSFASDEVTDDDVKKIIEAAGMAPSAGGLRAYKVIAVRDGRLKSDLAEAALGQESVSQAPVVLIFCADGARSAEKYGDRGHDLYSVQDATIGCAYAQLAVCDLGLASVWVGAFDEEKVAKILELSDNLRPVAILPVGKEK